MIGIYKITNVINDKCYIGYSKQIDERKSQHFRQLKNNKHENIKLQRAFNKYGLDNFKVEYLKLFDDYDLQMLRYEEKNFINIFDSFKHGYNLTAGVEYSYNADFEIHSFYNSDYGEIKISRFDFKNKYNINDDALGKLINEKLFSWNGWILSKNIDEYNRVQIKNKNYKFKHFIYGLEECTMQELSDKYTVNKTSIFEVVHKLGRVQTKGWFLEENFKEMNKLKLFKFYHKDFGTVEMYKKDFYEKYNLNRNCVNQLINGNIKQTKGWILDI